MTEQELLERVREAMAFYKSKAQCYISRTQNGGFVI